MNFIKNYLSKKQDISFPHKSSEILTLKSQSFTILIFQPALEIGYWESFTSDSGCQVLIFLKRSSLLILAQVHRNLAGVMRKWNVPIFGYMILYDVHITMPLSRGLHSASTLQEWSRKEAWENFLLMFCDDGDVVNFPMGAHWNEHHRDDANMYFM